MTGGLEHWKEFIILIPTLVAANSGPLKRLRKNSRFQRQASMDKKTTLRNVPERVNDGSVNILYRSLPHAKPVRYTVLLKVV